MHQKNFKFSILSIFWISIVGCASSPKANIEDHQKAFTASYESVWRAAQLSLKYPIALNNMDSGILETDWVKAAEGFSSPDQTIPPSSGIRYKIKMNFVKGRLEGKPSVKVKISKNIERHRDFFSEPEKMPSDGLEEKVIFYRMERELIIDEGLKKAFKN